MQTFLSAGVEGLGLRYRVTLIPYSNKGVGAGRSGFVKRKCPFAKGVVVYSTQFKNSFITRWYCQRAEVWCPYKGRRRECPNLPPASIFYSSVK
ncbi:MAG: hypothetical protein NZ954_07785 [Thermofilaceae archaeon]|nr:hypothetical protein [Thermofilaceae archaeon]MCX8179954.1 hypothetical protein [Thermofilaceae archaeon]MDW8004740.1 hypothetical protein [Thermofilaceae archaeon]